MEFTLLWAALTGVGLGWVGTRLWPRHLPDHPVDRMVGAAAAGLIAGRLTAMVTQGVNPITNPADILIVRGGVHTGAATAVAIVAFLWSSGWQTRFLDAMAPSALLALAGWHAGCLWRGTCLGTQTSLPWGWAEPGSAITRHPVELYAALGLAVAAWLVSRLPWRPLARSGVALAAAGLIRLATEPLRPSISGGPVWWYVAAIAVGALAPVIGSRIGPPSEPS